MKRFVIICSFLSVLALASCSKNNVYDICKYGAVADGKTVNTEAVQKAIDAAGEGATVLIPEGTFLCGTIYLKSNIEFKLAKGAVLKGVDDYKIYDSFVPDHDMRAYDSCIGGVNENSAHTPEWSRSFIIGSNLQSLVIDGEGTIDGSDVFNPLGEESMRGPHTLFLSNCRNVAVQGISIIHSGNYAVMAYESTNLVFDKVSIQGGWDGIHMRGVYNVLIDGCDFKTGDDSIAGGNWTNLVVRNCNINSSCNGFRMFFPSENVEVTGCHFYGPGINPHRTSGRTRSLYGMIIEPAAWGPAPGPVGNIYIHDCDMSQIEAPVAVNLSKGNPASILRIENLTVHNLESNIVPVKLSEQEFATTDVKNISVQ